MSVYQDFINKINYFSSIPAGAIDQIYLEEPKSVLSKAWGFIRVRALYMAFIGLTAVDMLTAGVLATSYAIGSLFTSENTQDALLTKQKQYATITGSRFYTLLASPIGFFIPKLVVFYFTPEKKNTTGVSAGGGYHHAPHAELHQPETPQELQALIKQALAEGRQIIPMGAGRSQGKQFLPDGNGQKPLVIDLQKMNHVEISSETRTANVGAGALWSDLQLAANKGKMAVKVMQASNVFSVGGSIGSNIHGWDYKNGMISNTINSMEIINTKGELQTVTPDEELFHHITGGLGLFGIVYKVNIQLAQNEMLRRMAINVAPTDYVQYFQNNLQFNDDIKLHLYRLSLDPKHLLSEGFTETYVATDGNAVKTKNFSIEPPLGNRLDSILLNVARLYGWTRKLWWDAERKHYLNNHPTKTTNEIMQAPINAMFNSSVSEAEWLQEYFLPGDTLAEFLDEFGKVLMDNNVSLLNATVRFVQQNDKSPLSYAATGDRFAVVICFNQSLQPSKIIDAKKWLRKAQHLSVEKGGAYYLPYQHVSSPDDFKKSFPNAPQAQAYKEKIDPQQLFTSGLHQKYIATKPTQNNQLPSIDHVKKVLSNPELKELFKGFLKNIFQRVDSKEIYALLDDILIYNDTHAEIYQELCTRLPEIMPSTLGDISNQLSSLAAIKKDLGEQAQHLLPNKLKSINGIVEIGSPGRFATGFKQHYNVKGKVVAVNETQSLGDYVDAGSFHPYDQFVPLDYSKLDLSKVADKSADVITCYVGLHHFSADRLDVFLVDVKRILSDGGHFLLVDHDVGDDNSDSMAMAHAAHFIFNAVNGVPLADEVNEVRDFKPISHWKEKLEEHGFGYKANGPDVAMIRPGDPTRNQMISFVNSRPELANILTGEEPYQEALIGQSVPTNWSSSTLPVAVVKQRLFAHSMESREIECVPLNNHRPK